MRAGGRIAVAVHDVEPATYERCALLRDWLADHDIDRVTLLVIPARDLHPAGSRSPEMVAWLSDCRRAGDAIAQHGFQHPPRVLGRGEFVGLDGGEARRAVEAGWRVLKLAGIEPEGFVAPGYAYTQALREALGARFRWWASLLHLHCVAPECGTSSADLLAPAFGLSTAGPCRRALSPLLMRAGAVSAGQTLRIDVRPGDLRYPRHMLAVESVLRAARGRRTAITYDELAQASE
ncbi:MAG TPA: DUF2334 domain-containing protein [Solirubrobacteraceae bacterium]|nr:DUF2334 domain-containing protein [Solirubrobacteraceae bacterium]